jgi:hypothetical protein
VLVGLLQGYPHEIASPLPEHSQTGLYAPAAALAALYPHTGDRSGTSTTTGSSTSRGGSGRAAWEAPRAALRALTTEALARHPDLMNRWNALQVQTKGFFTRASLPLPLQISQPISFSHSLSLFIYIYMYIYNRNKRNKPRRPSVFSTQVAFGVLLNQRGVASRAWSHAYRVPYWDSSGYFCPPGASTTGPGGGCLLDFTGLGGRGGSHSNGLGSFQGPSSSLPPRELRRALVAPVQFLVATHVTVRRLRFGNNRVGSARLTCASVRLADAPPRCAVRLWASLAAPTPPRLALQLTATVPASQATAAA